VRFAAHEDQDEPCEVWSNADLPGGIYCDASFSFIRVKPETAQVVAADEWVEHDRENRLYIYEGEPDQAKLLELVQFPEMAAEIERRDAEAAAAKEAERRAFEWQAHLNAEYEERLAAVRAKPPLELAESDLKWLPIRERLQLENKIGEARYKMREAAVAEWNAFEGVATQEEVEAWKVRHAAAGPFPGTGHLNIVTSERFLATARKEAAEVNEIVRARRFDAASLDGKTPPDREWLVPGLIPAGNVTLLYGDGGTGKSLLVLQLAVTTAIGSLFFGRPVKKGGVEFLSAEDSRDELHRRLVDICKATGVSLAALTALHITSLVDADASLAREGGDVLAETPLYRKVDRILAETRPRLLVLDTLADVFGGNEVVRVQARRFIGMLRRLCLQYDCAIVVLAHPSLSGMDKGTSGSTGWNNSMRSRLFFSRVHDTDGSEMDEDARVLRVGKLNYGRTGLEIPMRWKAGVFVEEGGAAGPDPLSQQWKAERVFLEMLDRANGQNVRVSASSNAGNYAPKAFARDALRHGVKKRDLVEAMQRLLDSRKIENAPYGSPARMSYQLQRTHLPDVPAPPL
jgi:RecA-family ATPase